MIENDAILSEILDTLSDIKQHLPNSYPDILTRAQAAEYLGVSLKTLDKLAAEGHAIPARYGGIVRYRRADLERLFATQSRKPY